MMPTVDSDWCAFCGKAITVIHHPPREDGPELDVCGDCCWLCKAGGCISGLDYGE